MVEQYPLQLGKPKRIDNIIGVSMLLSTIVFVFIGLYFNVRFIVGIPMILYGFYGIISKRIWVIGSAIGGGFTIREDSTFFGLVYVIIGIILSIIFQF